MLKTVVLNLWVATPVGLPDDLPGVGWYLQKFVSIVCKHFLSSLAAKQPKLILYLFYTSMSVIAFYVKFLHCSSFLVINSV